MEPGNTCGTNSSTVTRGFFRPTGRSHSIFPGLGPVPAAERCDLRRPLRPPGNAEIAPWPGISWLFRKARSCAAVVNLMVVAGTVTWCSVSSLRVSADGEVARTSSMSATEGVNTKTKLIKRQMYGRAGFRLLH
jgi:hypothetical protein